MLRATGAEIIVRLLERQMVSVVAGIPGGANLPLYEALSRSSVVRHVLTRHEQGAAFLAQGIARSTGAAGVCLATSGPGATNLLTAMADARLDSVPIICITAQVPRPMIGTEAFQEIDICSMGAAACKRTYAVRSAADLLWIVPEAFRIALSGRPGPVLIDVPKDVQRETAEFIEWPEPGSRDAHPIPDEAAIDRAAELINASARPLMVLGGGLAASGAGWRARRMAESASIPMAMTLMGLGAVRHDHPLSLGMLGMHGTRSANLAARKSDLLIVLGARLSDRTTGRVAGFCPQADVIHVNLEASEFGKIIEPDVAIQADAGDVLARLEGRIAINRRRAWRQQIARLSGARPSRAAGQLPSKIAAVFRDAARSAGSDAIAVTDVGQHQMWAAQMYPHVPEGNWLTSGGLGTMGFGLPTAIGAALAHRDRKVLCFSGDGSLLMNVQELATAAEVNADVKIILFDNRGLGLVRQQQNLFYDGHTFQSDFHAPTDFVRMAEAFGIEALELQGSESGRDAIESAIRRSGPVLIRIDVPSDENVYPMVPPGKANAQMISRAASRDSARARVPCSAAREPG